MLDQNSRLRFGTSIESQTSSLTAPLGCPQRGKMTNLTLFAFRSDVRSRYLGQPALIQSEIS
jgi:hypothetical protein